MVAAINETPFPLVRGAKVALEEAGTADFTHEIPVTPDRNMTSSVCNHRGRLVVWTTDGRDRDLIRPMSEAVPRHRPPRPGSTTFGESCPTTSTPPWLRRATTSRPLMIALSTVAVLAVAGTTWGYSSLSKSVTLTLDGKSEEVTAFGGTVGDVLADQGVEVGGQDEVPPALDEPSPTAPHLRPLRPAVRGQRRRRAHDVLDHADDRLRRARRRRAVRRCRLSASRGGRSTAADDARRRHPEGPDVQLGDGKPVRAR